MMKVSNISLMEEMTGRYLVKDLSLVINATTKLAIIGEEGNGKSSLLQVLKKTTEQIPYLRVTGSVTTDFENIGYLNQQLEISDKHATIASLFDEVIWEPVFIETMNAFKIDNIFSDQLYEELSGGEKLKYQLLTILSKNPDLLLLDEPTNNLDLAGLTWLETFIQNLSIPVVYISHDETFIQATANQLLHLELTEKNQVPCHTLSNDKFFTYQEKRKQAILTHNQQVHNETRQLKKQEEKMQQVWNKAAYQHTQVARADPRLQKKIKSLKQQKEKISQQKNELKDTRSIADEPAFFFQSVAMPKVKKLITHVDLSELINEKGLLAINIDLPIYTQDKLIITGENGVGKSTLLHQIYEELANQTQYKIGYMPQDYSQVVDFKESILTILSKGHEEETQKIRTLLANLNFTRDEVGHTMEQLSGGQQTKVMLIKLMLEANDMLLIDEPTRNLSPLTNQVFYQALSEYNGTIIAISHDRKFIKSLENHQLYTLTKNGLK